MLFPPVTKHPRRGRRSILDVVIDFGSVLVGAVVLIGMLPPADRLDQARLQLLGDVDVLGVVAFGAALAVCLLGAGAQSTRVTTAELTHRFRAPVATRRLLREVVGRHLLQRSLVVALLGGVAGAATAAKIGYPLHEYAARWAAAGAISTAVTYAAAGARGSRMTLVGCVAVLAMALAGAHFNAVEPGAALVVLLFHTRLPAVDDFAALVIAGTFVVSLVVVGSGSLELRSLRAGAFGRAMRGFALRRNDVGLFVAVQRELWGDEPRVRNHCDGVWRRALNPTQAAVAREIVALANRDPAAHARTVAFTAAASAATALGGPSVLIAGPLLWFAGLELLGTLSQRLERPRLGALTPSRLRVRAAERMIPLGALAAVSFTAGAATGLFGTHSGGVAMSAFACAAQACVALPAAAASLMLGAPRGDFAARMPPEFYSAAFFLRLSAAPAATAAAAVGARMAIVTASPFLAVALVAAGILLVIATAVIEPLRTSRANGDLG